MKNIHILTTNKPSRYWMTKLGNLTRCHDIKPIKEALGTNQNIYITSNEEIKEGDWVIKISSLYKGGGIAQKYSFIDAQFEDIIFKKIILTTDVDLIKDGVQAIDDEFLEWFVKNSSCEMVDVKSEILYEHKDTYRPYQSDCKNLTKTKINYYLSIIPKEENHSDIGSLIGKKVIWDSKEYTIIDKHNDSDFITIDDKNNSIVGLHWGNVCISKEETNYTVELNPHIGPFLLKNGFSKHKIRPYVDKNNVYHNSECIVTVLEDCYEIQFDEPEVGEVTTYTDSWSIPHLVGTLTWNDLIDRNYIK
jgi:hypothetical protein